MLLAEAPRRSALIMDSAKDGADGGCVWYLQTPFHSFQMPRPCAKSSLHCCLQTATHARHQLRELANVHRMPLLHVV